MNSRGINSDRASLDLAISSTDTIKINNEGAFCLSEYEKLIQFSSIIDTLKVSPLYKNCQLHQDMFKNIELLILKNLYNVDTL